MNSLSFKTDFGWISAFEVKNRIVRIKFGKCNNRNVSKNLRKLRSNISSFFNKRKRSIEANFYINGSINQKKIWKELKKIRIGQTKSYGEIAKKNRLPPRLVGKICSQNKLLLIVPCHRVIKTDGSLGGFTSIGGVGLKKKLLEFEKSLK